MGWEIENILDRERFEASVVVTVEEGGEQGMEDRGRKTDDRRQRTEDRRQKAEFLVCAVGGGGRGKIACSVQRLADRGQVKGLAAGAGGGRDGLVNSEW